MSQKERKRLSLEQLQMTDNRNDEVEQPGEEHERPKWLGWGVKNATLDKSAEENKDVSKHDPSLSEIMLGQKSTESPLVVKMMPKSAQLGKMKPIVNKKPKSWRTLDFEEHSSGMMDIKPAPMPSVNPWHTTPVTKDSSEGNSFIHQWSRRRSSDDEQQNANIANTIKHNTSFKDIMHEEIIQKEHLYRAQSKPLTVTQLEEQAIEELKVFYNMENTFDEFITVERANTSVLATPVWNPKRKQ